MAKASLGYSDTPILRDSGYRVHDGKRPQPPIVTPGIGTGAPSDATIIFDGTSLDGWESMDGTPAQWKLGKGFMEVKPKTGNIRTKQGFGSIQLHLEFATPKKVKGESQGRGNSGVFLMSRYEIQVLDNFDNPTYADGTVGAIYGQYPPYANAIRKPGEWNTYDIMWEAPEYKGERLVRPAYVTVILNNILLQHRTCLLGETGHRTLSEYIPHNAAEPLMLQDHGDLVRFRNIWARPIPVE
jgi:hypothetical protein